MRTVTGRPHRPVLNAIARTLIRPNALSVLANDKPAPSPAVQRQRSSSNSARPVRKSSKPRTRKPARRLSG